MVELPPVSTHETQWAAKARLAGSVFARRSEFTLERIVEALTAIYGDDTRIRFYALDGELAVFHDHRLQLPREISKAADYIEEARYGGQVPMGYVIKSRSGSQRLLVPTREPPRQPRTWFSRLLDTD